MTFSGHLAVSIFVLHGTHNPWLAIPLAFLLHLAADAIPHAEWRPWNAATAVPRLLMVVDLAATTALAVGAFYRFEPFWLVGATLLAGLLPDLTDKAARRYCRPFRRLHVRMHSWPTGKTDPVEWNRTVTGRTPTWLKLAVQAVLLGLAGLSLV